MKNIWAYLSNNVFIYKVLYGITCYGVLGYLEGSPKLLSTQTFIYGFTDRDTCPRLKSHFQVSDEIA